MFGYVFSPSPCTFGRCYKTLPNLKGQYEALVLDCVHKLVMPWGEGATKPCPSQVGCWFLPIECHFIELLSMISIQMSIGMKIANNGVCNVSMCFHLPHDNLVGVTKLLPSLKGHYETRVPYLAHKSPMATRRGGGGINSPLSSSLLIHSSWIPLN